MSFIALTRFTRAVLCERKDAVMKTHIKALGAIGSAGALMLLTLIGSGGAALASPSSVGPAQGTFVGSLKVPGSFQPAAASFVSPAWGVVLGQSGHTSRAQLAVRQHPGHGGVRARGVRGGR
jgi:hypothetical protein